MPRNLCPSGLGERIIFQFRLQILCSFVISSPFFCTLAVSFHVSGVRAGIEPATIDLLLYRPHPWSAWFLCSTMAELPHSYFSFNFYIPYVIPPRQEPACSAGISPPVLLRSHSSRLSVIILLLRLLPKLRKVRSTSYRVVPSDLFGILMHPPVFWCTPIIPLFPGGCIELVVYFPGMPYLIMEPFLHVDTLLATSSVAFLLHREVSVHYQILVFSIAARNASIEILLLVSVPDSDRKS